MTKPHSFQPFFPWQAEEPSAPRVEEILSKTTHLCIAAHQDDVEIMAFHGISQCFHNPEHFFTACILTNGAGSEKKGPYKDLTDDAFIALRKKEQQKAAMLGDYLGVVFLDFSSQQLRQNENKVPSEALTNILDLTRPEVVYTHSPFDFHATHTAACCRVIEALKASFAAESLRALYGCEVWGDLDWLPQTRKIALDCSQTPHLQKAIISVFDSQIARGKSFEEAAMGRRKANATFQKPRDADDFSGVTYALDLLCTVKEAIPIKDFSNKILEEFQREVHQNLF